MSHDHGGGPKHPGTATSVLLVGRPNAGKSSVYNRLTGGDAKVGNFPGVTVDVLAADLTLPGGVPVRVLDLPGVYSLDVTLDPGTDEGVARSFVEGVVAEGSRAALVQVLDASQLAAGLALTRELLARPLPLLVVLTQRDVLADEGRALSVEPLRAALGVPVIAVNARDPSSRATLLGAVAALVAEGARPRVRPDDAWDAAELERAAIRDADAVDARALRRRARTERLDRLLLHPVAGPAIFLGLMVGLFAAVYAVADPASRALDFAVQHGGRLLARPFGHGLLGSFVVDGLLGGAGTVLAFLPQIVILTAAMELLDSSGYLARGAFLVDGVLRRFGLGGRAFVPMLTAHACAVPAIAATRILRDPRERLTVILVLPLLTCSARIPTYGLLLAAFFPGRAWLQACLFVALYLLGGAAAVVVALVLRRSATKGRRLPLVLEMPEYRSPDPRAVARACAVAARRFVRDVGVVILACGAVLWALLHIPAPGAADGARADASAMERSIGASLGRSLEPVTRPLGFDWRINVGLIGSFGARELMVGTLGVISGIEDAGDHPESLATRLRTARDARGQRRYTARTGVALLVFFVFACQCMSTLAAVRRETRSWRWVAFITAYTYALAWAAAWVASRAAAMLGLD
ncbi:MAG: ferrous iron transporter B [Myxococcaceae bacterium]|nr:MAG: ferrous iron transporter B [Myxococcaceae bacterium]